MDPLTHTLVGASLGQTRLGRLSAFSTLTLILGANAPDIDAVTMLIDRDLSLGFRRGWTHGVLALVVLPLLLTELVWRCDRRIASGRGRAPLTRRGPLLVLSYIGVLSHPALDWLNTYGIRLLMPFDGRWFYGDALFIVDPWVWLLAAGPVVIAQSRSGVAIIAWLGLALCLTGLITVFGGLPPVAKLLWLGGLAAIAATRGRTVSHTKTQQLASRVLLCIFGYMLAMASGSRIATWQVSEWLEERGSSFNRMMAGPLPANPFVRDVVIVDTDHYHFVEVNWLRSDPIRVSSPSINRGQCGPVVDAAMTAGEVQGLLTWMRFPAFTVKELADGYRVTIQDVRYARRRGSGFSSTVVELDRDLELRPHGR